MFLIIGKLLQFKAEFTYAAAAAHSIGSPEPAQIQVRICTRIGAMRSVATPEICEPAPLRVVTLPHTQLAYVRTQP